MVSERVGSQLQYQCQYFLPASLVYIIGRLLTVFFVIEMLAVRRQLIPDDRFAALGRRAEAADWRPFTAADHSAFSRMITEGRQAASSAPSREWPVSERSVRGGRSADWVFSLQGFLADKTSGQV